MSLENIGPFKGKVFVNFKKGKYLIKAPIGTGKSFLFFDAPIFGLYKYSARDILNKKSKSGFVKIIFEVNGQNYLIFRKIKKTARGFSVSSELFEINLSLEELVKIFTDQKAIITKDFDFDINTTYLQPIKFKSERELDENLKFFLPPREVVTNTIFLLQDSQNIFELRPQERIELLKQIFALSEIDEVKKKIKEEKSKTEGEFKAKGDFGIYQIKFEHFYKEILEGLKYFVKGESFLSFDLEFLFDFRKKYFDFVFNFENLSSLKIEDFRFSKEISEIVTEIEKKLNEAIEKNTKISQSLESLNAEIQSLEKEKQAKELQIKKFLQSVEKLEKEKQNFDMKESQELLEKKQEKQKKLQKIDEEVKEEFPTWEKFIKNVKIWYDLSKKDFFENLLENFEFLKVVEAVEKIVDYGRFLRREIEILEKEELNLNEKMNEIDKKLENLNFKEGTEFWEKIQSQKKMLKRNFEIEIEKLEQKKQNLNRNYQDLQNRKKDLEKDLQELKKNFEQISVFHCPEIGNKVCPHIKKINISAFQKFEQQKVILEQKIENIEKLIQNLNYEKEKSLIEEKILEFKEKLLLLQEPEKFFVEDFALMKQKIEELNLQKSDFQKKLEQIQKNKQELNLQIEYFRNFYKQINGEKYKQKNEEKNLIEQEIQNLDKKITEIQKKQVEFLEFEKNLQNIKGQISTLQNELQFVNGKINEKILEKETLVKNLQILEKINLSQSKQKFEEFKKAVLAMKELVETVAEQILSQKKLQERLKILKDLDKIFSKELLILSLESILPVLEEILNNFLSQLTDYSLKFMFSTDENVKLDIKIEDNLGEREVKSLSGGQKVLLKLAWTLTIISYLRSNMVLLDETINNLDEEVVQKISNLLVDFVKEKDLKFYVVTHNKIIQQMEIWDEVLDLEKLR